MEEQIMEQMRELLYKAIQDQLRIPYQSRAFNGTPKKGISPRIASGEMLRSLKVEWEVDFEQGDPLLVVSFDTNPEFLPEMIDQGRKPSTKYPPLSAIAEWVKVKPIYFRDIKGRFVKGSVDQKVFLIARSIKEKGYKGINFLTKAEDQVVRQLTDLGEEAAARYFQNLIEEGLIIQK